VVRGAVSPPGNPAIRVARRPTSWRHSWGGPSDDSTPTPRPTRRTAAGHGPARRCREARVRHRPGLITIFWYASGGRGDQAGDRPYRRRCARSRDRMAILWREQDRWRWPSVRWRARRPGETAAASSPGNACWASHCCRVIAYWTPPRSLAGSGSNHDRRKVRVCSMPMAVRSAPTRMQETGRDTTGAL